MEAYLVVGRTCSDDVPLSLWATEQEAEAAARRTDRRAVEIAAGETLGVDISRVIEIGVVPFRCGLPGRFRCVKEDVG